MKSHLIEIGDELGIERTLIAEYSDGFNRQTSENLFKFLSLPPLKEVIQRIRASAPPDLYRQFIEELFEDSYAFINLFGFRDLAPADVLLPQAQGMIRPQEKRTWQSDMIRKQAVASLEPYIEQLRRLDTGCFLVGSSLYGDSNSQSDADVVFYAIARTEDVDRMFRNIKSDLAGGEEFGRVEMSDVLDLAKMSGGLEVMIARKATGIKDYLLPGRTILNASGWAALVHGYDLYGTTTKFRDEHARAGALLDRAIKVDPIMNFMIAYHAAVNIILRRERL